MTKILFFFIFVSALFGAQPTVWSQQESFKLKKDELADISIRSRASKGADAYNFTFKWTLVVGDRVTVLLSDRGHPRQLILYKKRNLDSASFDLYKDGASKFGERSYMLLVLSDVSEKKDIIDFNVYIKDDKKRVLVDFGKNEK